MRMVWTESQGHGSKEEEQRESGGDSPLFHVSLKI